MKYNVTLTTEHPIIKGHTVYGENLLPGLAYIDFLYQLIQDGMGLDYREYSLTRLSIYNPLIVSDNQPVKLEIRFEPSGDAWKITVGNAGGEGPGAMAPERLYITAELHPMAPQFAEQVDVAAVKQTALQCVDLETVYEAARKRGLVHQGMIKARGQAYLTKELGCFSEVSVDEAYHAEGPKALFHPTLIDGVAMAAGFLKGQADTGNNEDLYIPLYYESFSAIEPLRTHCYAMVDAASLHGVNEIRTVNIAFFNATGKQVAQLKGITLKRIRLKEQIKPGKETVLQERAHLETGTQYRFEMTSTYIESILRRIFAKRLKRATAEIDIDSSFYDIGLESSQLMSIVNEIESSLNLTLSPTLLFENNNIRELIHALKAKQESGNAPDSKVKPEMSAASDGNTGDTVAANKNTVQDIAIIGLAGRYPGANNMDEFWENLKEGRDCISEIPSDHWDYGLYFDADKNKPGRTYCKWGGFLEGVDQFDPLFFNISPRDAAVMDPMERLFLETVWDLLENTGYTQETLEKRYQSRVGVYAGAMYQQYHYLKSDPLIDSAVSIASYSSIANRISYFFNLNGPSVAVDTACSSSAVAIHMACESLIRGECQVAIAGGVNLSIHPNKYLGLSMMQILGSHPDSRSFGSGDGFLPAEGVGAVLLKPLPQAVRDGERILAVIKATATNHGGRTNAFFVPNPIAQAQLFEDNFKKSGVDPRTISYVEAAANGTVLGDPVEINALDRAFKKFTSDRQFCAIGSVKSNIGHAEAASGISQLSKVILQLQHRQLAPTIKTEPLNPNIRFENTPFYLQRELQEWKRPVLTLDGVQREFPRRATVSSFGAGGSNAHLIIEEYIPAAEAIPSIHHSGSTPEIVVFSARNAEQLGTVVQKMLEFVEGHGEFSISDLAYTLQVGREAMESRLAVIVQNREELIQSLADYRNKVEATIPTFSGELDEGHSNLRSLLSGKAEQALLQVFLAEKDWEKIALYWTQGGKIPWELLHEGPQPQILPLPTYPFVRKRYWITEQGQKYHPSETALPHRDDQRRVTVDLDQPSPESIQKYMVQFLAQQLHLAPDQIKVNKNLQEYGADSIVGMKLLRDFESRFKLKVTGREMLEYPTVNAMAAYLAPKIAACDRQTIGEDNGGQITSQTPELSAAEREAELLEKFRDGELTLEEIESLLDRSSIL